MHVVIVGIHNYFRAIEHKERFSIHISKFPREASGYIRSYAGALPADTLLRVYAVGGDGILFDCLNGVINIPNVELGAIPYGATNNFVHGFGKRNAPLFKDITLQCTSPSIPVDVMQVGGGYVLGYVTVGVEGLALVYLQQMFESMENNSLSLWLKRRFYKAWYLIAGLIANFNQQIIAQKYIIEVDGKDMSGSYRGVHISNGAFFAGNWAPTRTSRPDDGLLDVILGIPRGIFRPMLITILAYLQGRGDQLPRDFIVKQARKISISSLKSLYIGFDDESFFDTSLTLEILPGAVRFIDVTGKGFPEHITDI
jgi:diacylglycerol kinase family enzyme